MTPEDLSKFNLREGNVIEMTVRMEVGRGSLAPGYSTPSMLMDVGGDGDVLGECEDGVRRVLSFSFPDECIVSIERVRPALPGRWEWDGDSAVFLIRDDVEIGRIGPERMTLQSPTKWRLGEIAKVIEAVRNA